ncbi:MAG: DUF3486 family protein [Alphaproteobacteria bacterium]|nr:DUF3486 family protein [Alphaproteobacteria bacterium]
MARPSIIDSLPDDAKNVIKDLRHTGYTISEITEAINDYLKKIPVDLAKAAAAMKAERISRAAMGRHIQKIDKITEMLKANRVTAEVLVERGIVLDDNMPAKLNIALLQNLITKIAMNENDGDNPPIILGPKEAALLSKSLKDVVASAKFDTDRTLAIKKSLAEDGMKAVKGVVAEAAASGAPVTPQMMIDAINAAYGVA